MLTKRISMAAVGSNDAWTNFGGADKVASVAPGGNDDDSYIFSTASGDAQRFTLAVHGLPAESVILAVKLYRRLKRTGGANGSVSWNVFLGANSVSAGSTTSTSTWADATSTSLARPSGGVWTLDDLVTLEVRCLDSQPTNHSQVTTIEIVVEYAPSSVAIPMGAVGSNDAWTNSGGANKVASVLPSNLGGTPTHDDDGSYIVSTAQSQSQGFTLGSHGIPPAAVIDSVTVAVRYKRDGGTDGELDITLELSGILTLAVNAVTSAYTTTLHLRTTSVPSGSWQWADLATLLVGVRERDVSAGHVRVTSLYVIVGFTADEQQQIGQRRCRWRGQG